MSKGVFRVLRVHREKGNGEKQVELVREVGGSQTRPKRAVLTPTKGGGYKDHHGKFYEHGEIIFP